MNKILSIGDVHGQDLWKDFTHGSTYDFMIWKTAVDAGAPASDDFWKEMPFMEFSKIIFVGDYVDSFTVSNDVIKQNLLDIIYLKRALPDKVVLLLGNHDVQYIVPNQICSGFRNEMSFDLQEIFRENRDLFKVAHFESLNGMKWLWTHAGVTKGWLKEARESLKKPDRFHAMNRPYASKELDVMINWLWETESEVLFQSDRDSGGPFKWASPLWVRPRMLNEHYVRKYNQVVGHTPRHEVVTWDWDEESGEHSIYYIDCLSKQKTLII